MKVSFMLQFTRSRCQKIDCFALFYYKPLFAFIERCLWRVFYGRQFFFFMEHF